MVLQKICKLVIVMAIGWYVCALCAGIYMLSLMDRYPFPQENGYYKCPDLEDLSSCHFNEEGKFWSCPIKGSKYQNKQWYHGSCYKPTKVEEPSFWNFISGRGNE